MKTFLVGTNRFEGCETLIGRGGVPVLRIEPENSALLVSLKMPEGVEDLEIDRNQLRSGAASIVASSGLTSVVKNETLVLHAASTEADEVLVHLDLRPLGVAIHTDAAGLHIGKNVLSGNLVQGAQTAVTIS
jgi:hypothetical protein